MTWQAPEFDGGSPITGYYVEKRSGSKRWSRINKKSISACELRIDDLIGGSEYEMRVCAENEAGTGEPSATTGKFIAKEPYEVPGRPDAPTVGEITALAATLSWQPPASDGGAPITGYVVEMRSGGDAKWRAVQTVEGTEATVGDLTEETEYEFRVAAQNKAGVGKVSQPSKPAKYGKQQAGTGQTQDR